MFHPSTMNDTNSTITTTTDKGINAKPTSSSLNGTERNGGSHEETNNRPSKRSRISETNGGESKSVPSSSASPCDKEGSTSTCTANDASGPAVATKNDKTPADAVDDNIISSNVIKSIDSITKSYQENTKPYPHGVVEDVFVDGFLEKVLDEVKHNFKAKFKESDLFRVYQSIDLGNLDPQNTELAESIPSLMKLRRHLYSKQCRNFMEDIACIPRDTITDKVDCAVNCHDQGCHLLCHDDVIGTRKLSYILYLTDPEPTWKDEDGGRLELYDNIEEDVKVTTTASQDVGDQSQKKERTIKRKVPGVVPVKTILPKFNSMAYFVVEPGVSFHSVQEVFCDRPRLSIQGWYHAKETPKEMEHASLNQLKASNEVNGEIMEEEEFTPIESGSVITEINSKGQSDTENEQNLTSKDIEFLSTFINKTYLKTESIDEIRQRFEEESSVQLRHFFNEEWENKVKSRLLKEDTEQNVGRGQPALDYSVGINEDWTSVGPAHKQRFLEYVGNNAEIDGSSCGSVLSYLKKMVFQSPQFGRLLKNYTSLGFPLGYRGKVRRFRPGLDYTIAHYGILTKEAVLDATMCFVRGSGKQSLGEEDDDEDDILWQSDDKGGFECYIAADDEDEENVEAADEYNDDDDTKLLSVSASHNTLSLVYRDPGTMRFVKYVGSGAPSSRWDIAIEYQVEDDDEETQDE